MNKKILYFEINGTGAVYSHSGMSGMSKTVKLRIQTAKVSFLCRVAGLYCSIRDGARTAAPACRNEPVEVVWASG